MQAIEQRLGARSQLQATRPQSLAWATAGNLMGQAAWIIERFHDWAHLRQRPFGAVFTRDQFLTTALIYFMTGAFTISA